MPDGGRIINISSQTSLIGFPGVAAYSMAKGALDILTKVAAKHLAPRNITVNAVLPGIADTDMNASWLRGNAEARESASSLQRLQAHRRRERHRRYRRLSRQQ